MQAFVGFRLSSAPLLFSLPFLRMLILTVHLCAGLVIILPGTQALDQRQLLPPSRPPPSSQSILKGREDGRKNGRVPSEREGMPTQGGTDSLEQRRGGQAGKRAGGSFPDPGLQSSLWW